MAKRGTSGKKGGGGDDVCLCLPAEVRNWLAKRVGHEGKKAKRQKGKKGGLGGKSISLTFMVSAMAYASVSNPMLSFFSFCTEKKRKRRYEMNLKKSRRN